MQGSQAGNGVPDLDRCMQIRVHLPWREWVLCSLSLPDQPPKLLERSLGSKDLPKMFAHLRQPTTDPVPGRV